VAAELGQGMIREHDVGQEVVQGVTQLRFALHALAREGETGPQQLRDDQLGVGDNVFDQEEAVRFRGLRGVPV